MPFHSPKSPRDFSHRGFQQLPTDAANANHTTADMPYENDTSGIPLSAIQTRSSSSGIRKIDQGASAEHTQKPAFEDEKKTWAGRRKLPKTKSRSFRVATDGEEIHINGLGRLYDKIINFSIVTRYFVYVLPIALVIAAPIIFFAIKNPNALLGDTNVRVYLFFTWIEIVWVSIWISKLISKAIPYVFVTLCGVVSSGTRKYASILHAVEIPMSLVGWAVACLVTFTALTGPALNGQAEQRGWVVIMQKLLAPALISSVLLLGQKMLIQLISINYHRRSFDSRIKESKHSIYLLGLLYEASRSLFPMYCQEFLDEDYIINDSIQSMLADTAVGRRRGQAGSRKPLRLVGEIGRIGDKVTSVFGNIASEITGKQVFNPNSAHSVVIEALEKARSSEALAKRLWMSFVIEGNEAMHLEDLQEVFGPARSHEAEECFSALDVDENGDITLDEMIMKVTEIGRERKTIVASMHDVGQAIGVLDQVLSSILFVIVVFIFVAFQDTSFVAMLATAGTTLLSLSFVFAVTTQEFLGSCIFLFVKHPYDVGDRVDISKTNLVVEQISLLYTVFKQIDSMKMVQVPNIVLNTLWIENVTRSNAMKEQLELFISFDTSLEDVEALRSEMEAFVRAPDNARDFQPDIILEATGVNSMDKLSLKVEIRHKSNWHNETVRAARRSKFMCALVLAIRKIPIYGPGGGNETLGGPNNPGYSVTVTDEFAALAREEAAMKKEAKRLIPSPPKADAGVSNDGKLGVDTEAHAADALNHRTAAATAGDDTEFDDSMRQELVHRESTTRGRRRPGDVASLLLVQQKNSDRNVEPAAGASQVLDEESVVGIHPRPSTRSVRDSGGLAPGNAAHNSYLSNMVSPSSPTGKSLQQQQQQGRR